MVYTADLHIHSRYSMATSREMTLENIFSWSQIKGITIVGTGDFTHPLWFKELQEKLQPVGKGLFTLRGKFSSIEVPPSCKSEVYFVLTTEVSCVYKRADKTRRVHVLLLVPDFEIATCITRILSEFTDLAVDGRPTLRIDVKKLLEIVIKNAPDVVFVPAHVWTPHYSIFGSGSGFDSLQECFEELSPYVYALETGLSSDPSMNWRISALDDLILISNSDAHSPISLGREANIFDTDLSYWSIKDAIMTKKGLISTIESYPEFGKYHYDGHRGCGQGLSPRETLKNNYLCPHCGKRVTVGVMHRIELLADRPEGFKPKGYKAFYKILPLREIIAWVFGASFNSKRVQDEYFRLISLFGNELKILLDVSLKELKRYGSVAISLAIQMMRNQRIHISPGFDGKYGAIDLNTFRK